MTILMILVDLIAISILVFGLYFPRHRRTDLIVAFLGVNVGVLAVAMTLATTEVGLGLGLGLFGVLSIIRLRSSEITQREIAYYFASLAIGLLAGLATTPSVVIIGLIALILAALAIGDSSALFGRWTQQTITLDRAITTESELRAELGSRLDADIARVSIIKVDLVNDLTVVDVRARTKRPTRARGPIVGGVAEGVGLFIDEGDALSGAPVYDDRVSSAR